MSKSESMNRVRRIALYSAFGAFGSAFVIRPPGVAERRRVLRHFVGTPINLPKVVRLL
jgi:hypothetical protein